MLNRNQRIIVEAIKKAPAIEIRLIDRGGSDHYIRVSREKGFSHDIAMAVQKYFNENAHEREANPSFV